MFWSIVFPLMRPAVATMVILNTFSVWNDFVNPQIILGPGSGLYTVTTGVYAAVSQYSTDYTVVFPTLLLAVAPLLVFFVLHATAHHQRPDGRSDEGMTTMRELRRPCHRQPARVGDAATPPVRRARRGLAAVPRALLRCPTAGCGTPGPSPSRDGADDFYEAFFNWPVLYQLGGADDLLDAAKRHWEGVTRQLTELGFLVDEFERGYDWFHHGRVDALLLLHLRRRPGATRRSASARAASPSCTCPAHRPATTTPATKTIRAPHNGARRPALRASTTSGRSYGADLTSMRPYGLPLPDVPGIASWDDLEDPANAARWARR